MVAPARYRIEHGEPIVDVKLTTPDHLFDNRDPAPFRERDLDPALVEYLVASTEDLPSRGRVRIVLWLEQPSPPAALEAAIRAHFSYELERLARIRRRQRRGGWIALIIAAGAMVALLAFSELVASVVAGSLGAGLKEALVISGWVLMWRPVEVLVYDGIPWRRERRVLRRILAATVDVRVGKGPPG